MTHSKNHVRSPWCRITGGAPRPNSHNATVFSAPRCVGPATYLTVQGTQLKSTSSSAKVKPVRSHSRTSNTKAGLKSLSKGGGVGEIEKEPITVEEVGAVPKMLSMQSSEQTQPFDTFPLPLLLPD